MPLAPQTIQIPFAGGVDEGTQSYLLTAQSAFASLSNLTHDKRGALTKSRGCEASSYTKTELDGGTVSSGKALTSLGDAVVMVDGNGYVKAYSPSFAKWQEAGRLPACTVSRTSVAGTSAENPSIASAYASTEGLLFVSYTKLLGSTIYVWCAVVEASTGVVLQDSQITDGINCKMIACGSTIVAAVAQSGGTSLEVWSFDAATPLGSWTSRATYGGPPAPALGSTALLYDLDSIASTHFVIAYAVGSGTNRVQLRRVAVSGWADTHTTTIATASTTPTGLSIGGTDTLWVGYAYDTNARAVALSWADLSSVGTTDTIEALGAGEQSYAIVTTGTQTADWVGSSLVNGQIYRSSLTISAGAVVGGTTYANHGRGFVISHGRRISSENYVIATSYEGTLCLARWSDAITYDGASDLFDLCPVAVFSPRLNGSQYVTDLVNQHIISLGSSRYAIALPVKRANGAFSAEVVTFDFTPEAPTKANFAECVQFSGGVLTQYDGRAVAEVNQLDGVYITHANATANPAHVADGAYYYVVVEETIDASGNWHAGPPCTPTAHTVSGGPRAVTCTIYAAPASIRGVQRKRFAVYRTEASGAFYYLVGYAEADGANVSTTLSDTLPDATLITKPALYWQPSVSGTEQPHRTPPGLRCIAEHQDRIVGVADDGVTVWYSAPRLGGEGVWFADAFQFAVEPGGPVEALWSQDGRLVVAKADRLYVVDGDGPPNNGGSGNEFSLPVRLPSDVGAISPRVCVTSIGTFFRSRRGVELLDRSFQVQWIGGPIEDTLTTYPDLVSATVDAEQSLVYLAVVDDEDAPTASRVLVYDLSNKSWEVHTTAAVVADMAIIGGVWHYLSTGGQVYKQRSTSNASAYLDSSAWRTSQAVTGWVSFGMLQDAKTWALQLLFERHTDHDLTIEIAYDYSSTWATAGTYTSDELYSLGGKVEIRPQNARAHAFRLRITDATPSGATRNTVGSGKGSTLVGLAVDMTPRQGATKGGAKLQSAARR
jgi:hypothetical protein